MRRPVTCVWLFGTVLMSGAHGAQQPAHAPSVEMLLETSRTILDQELVYPEGRARITAQRLRFPPGTSTPLHRHRTPLFAYVLEGEFVVDYGTRGERTYRRGDAIVEAIDWPHRGRNTGPGARRDPGGLRRRGRGRERRRRGAASAAAVTVVD
ncbi:MAG TPA: cupin domain-containing protein [Vicinamibacterales bacterium]